MKSLNNPYLTIINSKTKFNPENFKGFEYDEVHVRFGDWGKKTGLVEKQTHLAYKRAVEEFESIGATCKINSAGRTKFDQVYTKIEKFGGVLKSDKSITKAFKDTKNLTAKIGYSEHLSCLALDLKIDMDNAQIPEKLAKRYPNAQMGELKFLTKRYIMEKNGFILSYPTDDRLTEVTGLSQNEGWHWRYIGPEHSQMIAKIREKVAEDLGEKHEVFLEDYVELLSRNTENLDDKELLDFYCETFKKDILKLENENTNTL